jgi:hypothetical protein
MDSCRRSALGNAQPYALNAHTARILATLVLDSSAGASDFSSNPTLRASSYCFQSSRIPHGIPLPRAHSQGIFDKTPRSLTSIPPPRTNSQGILTRLPSLQCQGIFHGQSPPPKVKVSPREYFVPKGFSKSFLPNSSGYGVITTTNLAIPAHKDGSKNTSNQVFSQLLRCQTTLTNTPILVERSF